jgi:hypothetical protein
VVEIIGLVLTCAVCAFFVYVLVQFRRDEKHPRRQQDLPTGVPIVASGQIVGPLANRNGRRLGHTAREKNPGGSSKRRYLR